MHYVDHLRLAAGGVVRSVLDLTDRLARSGVRVTLLTGDADGAPDAWRGDPVAGRPRVIEAECSPAPWRRTDAGRETLRRAVGEADVVHMHTPWDPFNRVVGAVARRAGKPWILTAHGMLDDHCMEAKPAKKRIYLALGGRRFVERAARVHFTSEVEREQSRRRAPALRPTVLPLVMDLPESAALPGPDAARNKAPDGFASGEPVVMFLGRLHPIKGLDGLIEALARVTADGLKSRLLLVGPVEPAFEAQLRRRIDRLDVSDRVHFVGMVHGDEKFAFYRACDLYVLPSHHENFGLALVEAMASGAAAMTTKSVNIWPELESFGATIVEDSVDGLEGGLRRCLTDLDGVKARADAGRAPLREWLDPERLGHQYADLYRDVINEAKNGAV